jgi:DNA polymerase III alpha subunit (gram-positive type)
MADHHFLFFDTETGGFDSKVNSLLTAYFGVYDSDLNFIDDLYLQLKPSDLSKLNVNKDALDVNKINIEEHINDPNTITYEEGAKKLMALLEKNKIPRKRKSFIPAGHNISFDYNFIWDQLMDKETWEKNVHYRKIDTNDITSFLKDVNIFPEDLGNLGSLVEYFGIPMGEAHNAKGDIEMNVEVYRRIRSLMNAKKKEMIGNSSLLSIIEE